MAFAKVQYAANNNTGNTVLTVTLGASTTVHNLLVLTHSNDGGASPGAVPTSITLVGTGQNFTMITSASQTNSTASIVKSIWYLKDIPAGATQITATIAATNAQLMEVEEFSGADTVSPLITNAFAASNAPSGTQQTSYDSTAAPSGAVPAGSLWVGGFTGVDSGTHPTINSTQGFTLETAQIPGSSSSSQLGYILSSSNATPQFSGSITAPVAGAWWAAVVAAFQPPATTVTVTGVTATVTVAAVAGTVTETMVGTTATVTASAVAGTVTETIVGVTSTVSASAPAGAANITMASTTATVSVSAIAGIVQSSMTGVTASVIAAAIAGTVTEFIAGVPANVSVSAIAGTPIYANTVIGATANVSVAAIAGTVVTGQNAPLILKIRGFLARDGFHSSIGSQQFEGVLLDSTPTNQTQWWD